MSVISALRPQGVGGFSPLSTSTLRARKAEMPEMHSAGTRSADRWHLVCRLLADPIGESMGLVALLERLPGERHRHRIVDDCARRQWGRA